MGMGSGDASFPVLPPRDRTGHKGTFGTMCVVGGCGMPGSRMFGAPALAARAGLRAGCGLARLLVPEPTVDAAISLVESATAIGLAVDADGALVPHECAEVFDSAIEHADSVVIGPGLGPAGAGVCGLVLRALGQEQVPVVVDADGLNALASVPGFQLEIRASAVLTPHPGEFQRLAGALNIAADGTDSKARPGAAEAMARRLGCVVVLKGAGTVVSDGLRTWVCGRGHPCLGTAGTGDVLAGLIGGLIAQYVATGPRAIGSVELPRPAGKPLDLFDAARLGVEAHAIAGELWADQNKADGGMLAGELADLLPVVLQGFRAG